MNLLLMPIDKIKKAISNPRSVGFKLNRVYWREKFDFGSKYNTNGVDIFNEEWDNLIILDACRYDEFATNVELLGKLDSRISRGSHSREFIRGNFTQKSLHDTVYVSANGNYGNLKNEIDASITKFVFVERDEVDGRTSHPTTVRQKAEEIFEEYPNKRLIVHFMQPHQPYLGPTGREMPYYGGLMPTAGADGISHEEIIQAYRENIDLAVAEVEKLLKNLGGKSVVTADHGEILGERLHPVPIKWYGHPRGHYMEELVKVPWHVYEDGSRRRITSGEPQQDEYDLEEIDQHLKDLGYKS